MSQPGLIDGFQFARDRSRIEGALGLGQLPRLAEMQCETAGLRYRLEGEIDADGRAWLNMDVAGSVQLECQRCLGKLDFPLSIASRLELVREWRDMADADDEVDRVQANREMDVAMLVEDEVILALPMVPRHERCETGIADDEAETVSKSPFGALAALKKQRGGK